MGNLGRELWSDIAILLAFRNSVEQVLWAKASEHFCGRGIGNKKPSFSAAAKAKQTLVKQGLLEEVAALDSVVAGGVCTGDRFGAGTRCVFCGDPDSSLLRFYTCSRLGNIPDPQGYIAKTRWAIQRAKVEGNEWQVFWFRALLPACEFDRPENQNDQFNFIVGDFSG